MWCGDEAEVRRLVRQGMQLDDLVDKRSPLMRAAMDNKLAMVNALLDKGASVDFKNEDGWTALHFATKHGAVDVAEALLDAGADIEAKSNSGRTPLAIACNQRKLTVAKKLLDRGADTSTTDSTGWTLLLQAARGGSLEVVRWLVEEVGFDPRGGCGHKTAKELADSKGHADVSSYLSEADTGLSRPKTATQASPKVGSAARTTRYKEKIPAKSNSASESFLEKNEDEAEVRRLVRQGMPLEGLVDKRSRLMRAAMDNKLAMVLALLDMGASVDFKNEDGWTALHFAARHGAVDVTEALLDAGADIEARSISGRTPLAMACNQRKLTVAKKLLDRGADTSTTDSTGWTLLLQAARGGSLEVVRWLVEEVGFDPHGGCGHKTAKDLADSKGHADICKYLSEADTGLSHPKSTTQVSTRVGSAARATRDRKTISVKSNRASESFLGGAPFKDLKVRLSHRVVPPGPDVYDTTTDPPGLVLLLNYITFSLEDYKDRQGAEHDTVKIESVFKQMGYEVESYMDLTRKDTKQIIKEFSSSERLQKVGCVIVVVSSHGGSDPSSFKTSDGKEINVRYLHQSFINDQVNVVRQMAKIFLFQFCRGEDYPMRETDSIMDRCPKNIISFYSTSDGFVSYRDTTKGSFFLSAVCEVLAERAFKDNLDDLFRQVQRKYEDMGLGTTPEKQDLGFYKKFYFNPRPRKCQG